MNITSIACPPEKYAVKCPYPMTPTRVVIHNTANDASAYNEIRYMHRREDEVSFHYAVDDIGAVQGIPLDRNAWHAGDGGSGRGNREGIAIEICYSRSGGERFRRSVRNAAALTHALLTERGWGDDRVTAHRDYSGKYCPHRILDDYGFAAFRDLVRAQGITTADAALDRLATLGVVDTPVYWRARVGRIRYLDLLLERCARAVIARGDPLPNVDAALDALVGAGVMDTPAYWRAHIGDDRYLPALLKKLGGAL